MLSFIYLYNIFLLKYLSQFYIFNYSLISESHDENARIEEIFALVQGQQCHMEFGPRQIRQKHQRSSLQQD